MRGPGRQQGVVGMAVEDDEPPAGLVVQRDGRSPPRPKRAARRSQHGSGERGPGPLPLALPQSHVDDPRGRSVPRGDGAGQRGPTGAVRVHHRDRDAAPRPPTAEPTQAASQRRHPTDGCRPAGQRCADRRMCHRHLTTPRRPGPSPAARPGASIVRPGRPPGPRSCRAARGAPAPAGTRAPWRDSSATSAR